MVTGAGRGIGLACAAALAEAGAHTILLSRTESEIAAVAEAIRGAGGSADHSTVDITDLSALRAVMARHGAVDVFVNNAGTARHADFLDVAEADFDAVMQLNLRAAFFAAQAAAQLMVAAGKHGSIINVSSQMGHVGAVRRSVYAASKHALEGMTKAAAIDLGRHFIRVNTLAPTFNETPLTRRFFDDPAFTDWVLSRIQLGRIGQMEDLMGPLVFLASDASRFMTGASLRIDGGWTAG
jgi:NAD(P)-dependent dehydrogenase (short-subunit alcohol dehydrogenase family)